MKIKSAAKLVRGAFAILLAVCVLCAGIPAVSAEEYVYVTSFSISDVNIVKNDPTYYLNAYCEDGEGNDWYEWKYTDYGNLINYTAELSNGDTIEGTGTNIEDDEYGYIDCIVINDNQSAENKWDLGANIASASLGYSEAESEFTVNIIASDIDKFEIEDVEVMENYNLTTKTDEKGSEYSAYYYPVRFKITMKNGEEISDEEQFTYIPGIEYQVSINLSDGQSADNKWDVGEHIVKATILDKETTFKVNVKSSGIKKFEIEDAEIIENTNIEDDYEYDEKNDEEIKYKKYDYSDYAEYKLTMEDGSVIKGSGRWLTIADNDYSIRYIDDQSSKNKWSVGEHTVKASLLGKETEFKVNVVASPVESIEIEDISVIENVDGEIEDWWEDEEYGPTYNYFCYDYTDFIEYKVTLKSGKTIKGSGRRVDYNDQLYRMELTDDQSGKSPWTVGEHTVNVKLMGLTSQFKVNVISTPVKSIEVENFSLIKNTDGDYETTTVERQDENEHYYDEEVKWFRYKYYPNYKITLKDGTVFTQDEISDFGYTYFRDRIELLGRTYYFEPYYNDGQSYSNQWDIGEHNVKGKFLGVDYSYKATLVDTPIKDIKFSDITLYYNVDGYRDYEYIDGKRVDYFDYRYSRYLNMESAELLDGSKLKQNEEDPESVDYNGKNYSIRVYDDQSPQNEWGLGTHKATVSVLGYETDINVNIVKVPVKEIRVNPVELIQGYNDYDCYLEDEIDDDMDDIIDYDDYVAPESSDASDSGTSKEKPKSWRKYSYQSDISGEIVLEDGSIVEFDRWGGYFDERSFDIEVSDDQSYQNPWGIGKHTANLSLLGTETTIDINVVENPYKAFEILSTRSYDEDNPYACIRYFKYRVTKKNGESFVGVYDYYEGDNDEYIGGVDYNLSEDSSKLIFTPSYCGIKTEYTIKLPEKDDKEKDIKKKDGFYYYIENDKAYITDYVDYNDEEKVTELVIPSEIDGKEVVAVLDMSWCFADTITVPDTVTLLGDRTFDMDEGVPEVVNIGSSVKELKASMFYVSKKVNVSEKNPNYTSVDGVVYNKAMDTLIYMPESYESEHTIPDTVKDISSLSSKKFENVKVSDKSKFFKLKDKVIYNADMTAVIAADTSIAGDYVMPDSVERINECAFANCSHLESVKISKNVTEITYGDFNNCDSLKKAEFPENLKKIDNRAFYMCKNLSDAPLNKKLEEIGDYAFYYAGYKDIVVPDSVKEIGDHSFSANNAKTITLGDSLEKIGAYSFSSNQAETLTLGESLEEIGDFAFVSNKFTSVTIPDKTRRIGSYAFSGCNQLKELILKTKDISFGERAFYDCPIENLSIDGLRFMGAAAFNPDTISTMKAWGGTVSDDIYTRYRKLTDLKIKEGSESNIISCRNIRADSPYYKAKQDGLVYTEIEGTDNLLLLGYKGDMPANYKAVINEKCVAIAAYAFEKEANLSEIVMPSSLAEIGEGAFLGCTGLKTLSLPASVRFIGEFAFSGCDNLSEIKVDSANKYLSDNNGVLYNKAQTELIFCPKRTNTTFEVPSSVAKIRNFAIEGKWASTVKILGKKTELAPYAVGRSIASVCTYRGVKKFRIYFNDVSIVCVKGSEAEKYSDYYLFDKSETAADPNEPDHQTTGTDPADAVETNSPTDGSGTQNPTSGNQNATDPNETVNPYTPSSTESPTNTPDNVKPTNSVNNPTVPVTNAPTLPGTDKATDPVDQEVTQPATQPAKDSQEAKTDDNKKPTDKTEKVRISAGKTKKLKVTGQEVKKWKSSNKKIVKVSTKGKITALKKGTATVTATLKNGAKHLFKITVSSSPTLKINGKKFAKTKTYALKVGDALKLKISGKASAINNKYTNNNKKVAKVVGKKKATNISIKGLTKGKATVSVKVNGAVTFKVKIKVSI